MNGEMNRVDPHNGVSPQPGKGWRADACCNVGAPRKHGAKWKEPDAKGHLLSDPVYVKCPEEANSETKK